MKLFKLSVLCLITFTMLQSCLQDSCTQVQDYTQYNPVMMHVDNFRKLEINTEPSFKLENPGKIYFYKNYLLINELGQGIHFYDMVDPKNPEEKIFYSIQGNFDMAIKDDVLIADDAIDLLSIDISDIFNPKLIHRVENYKEQYIPENKMIVAYYLKSNVVRSIDCSNSNFGTERFFEGDMMLSSESTSAVLDNKSGGTSNNSQTGIGGSFARFTIYEDYLYAVDHSSLNSYKINGGKLEFKSKNNFGWGIETIFPFKDKLFIGSNSGMFIFDNSSPEQPLLLSQFEHASACDPVVVSGDRAYVTLRSGNACQGFTNQLDVIDIKSLTNPKLIKSYSMSNPHGLSVRGNVLYLCEGSYGLKTLDVSNAESVSELAFDKNVKSYDVISLDDNRLFVIGEDGFYQYNNTDPKNLKLLSRIPVQKN